MIFVDCIRYYSITFGGAIEFSRHWILTQYPQCHRDREENEVEHQAQNDSRINPSRDMPELQPSAVDDK